MFDVFIALSMLWGAKAHPTNRVKIKIIIYHSSYHLKFWIIFLFLLLLHLLNYALIFQYAKFENNHVDLHLLDKHLVYVMSQCFLYFCFCISFVLRFFFYIGFAVCLFVFFYVCIMFFNYRLTPIKPCFLGIVPIA